MIQSHWSFLVRAWRPKRLDAAMAALQFAVAQIALPLVLTLDARAEEPPKAQNVDACSYDFRDDRTSQIRVVCEEAKAAEKAEEAQYISGTLHAVVAAMCLSTCIWPWSQYACPIGSMTAGVADVIITAEMTKDYSAATSGLASLGTGALQIVMISEAPAAAGATANNSPLVGTGSTSGGTGPAAEPSGFDPAADNTLGADGNSGGTTSSTNSTTSNASSTTDTRSTGQKVMCAMSTLLEVAQTAIKFNGAKESHDLRKERLAEAKRIALTKQKAPILNERKPTFAAAQLPGGPSNGVGLTSDETPPQKSGDCHGALGSGHTAKIVSCARSVDPTLPSFIESKEFQDDFKKMSGQDLGKFLQNVPEGASASQIMGAALANTGAGPEVAKLNAKYENYFKDYQRQRALAAYSGGGGGGAGGSKGGKDIGQQMTDIMGDLMKKMTGEGEGGQAANPNVSMMKFGFANKHPDQVVQDRSVSLFDRVYYRYTQAAARVETWGWQSPYNRAIASQPVAPPPAATSPKKTAPPQTLRR